MREDRENGSLRSRTERIKGGVPIKERLLSLLFPPRCVVCDGLLLPGEERVCPGCAGRLSYVEEPRCKCCGRGIPEEDGELCESCKKQRFSFEYGLILLHYNEAAMHSMAAVKYHGRQEYLSFYGQEAAKRLGEELRRMQVQALVPVPLHRSRLRKRGYNQAELLAEQIGSELRIPVCPELLFRRKKTAALRELSAAERLKHLSDAFSAGEIPGDLESVCLVDDIFTSGATIEACTRVLKRAGIRRVYSFCLCAKGDE